MLKHKLYFWFEKNSKSDNINNCKLSCSKMMDGAELARLMVYSIIFKIFTYKKKKNLKYQ